MLEQPQTHILKQQESGLTHSVRTSESRPAVVPTQPPSQWVPGANGPEREANHSLTSSAKVNNGGAIPPLPHTASWRGD
jgi:hypothetical protein